VPFYSSPSKSHRIFVDSNWEVYGWLWTPQLAAKRTQHETFSVDAAGYTKLTFDYGPEAHMQKREESHPCFTVKVMGLGGTAV
jgi:hypothetical protein